MVSLSFFQKVLVPGKCAGGGASVVMVVALVLVGRCKARCGRLWMGLLRAGAVAGAVAGAAAAWSCAGMAWGGCWLWCKV